MWDRKAIKARGKQAFQANYWKCVLVALIVFLFLGGSAGSSGKKVSSEYKLDDKNVQITSWSDVENAFADYTGIDRKDAGTVLKIVLGAVAGIALVGGALKILVINPLTVGCCQFFVRNSDSPAALNELGRAFKPEWLHNVVTMLLRNLFIALWMLLLVVPGIIKAYAYRLTPYIQAEHPELSGTQAIKLSNQMMKGHKWNSFVYDLSFIGWYLLEGLTLGLVGIFYVNPYKEAADAELYRAISDEYSHRAGI